MKHVALVLLLAVGSAPAFGQHLPPLPPLPFPPMPQPDVAPVESRMVPPPMPLQVKLPTKRGLPYDRIMYVLDVSGSMSSKLSEAIRVTGCFGSDDSKVAVVTFNDGHQRWKGVKQPCKHLKTERHGRSCLEPGWAFMPLHVSELMGHLGSFTGNGGTNPTSALRYTIRNAPEGTLIVFVSDGDFDPRDGEGEFGIRTAGPLSTVRAAQKWRQKQKLAPVQILVWATSKRDSKRESLVELAKLGGGGLWRADAERSGPW